MIYVWDYCLAYMEMHKHDLIDVGHVLVSSVCSSFFFFLTVSFASSSHVFIALQARVLYCYHPVRGDQKSRLRLYWAAFWFVHFVLFFLPLIILYISLIKNKNFLQNHGWLLFILLPNFAECHFLKHLRSLFKASLFQYF